MKEDWGHLLNGQHQDAHEFFLAILEASTGIHHIPSIASNFECSLKSTLECLDCGQKIQKTTGTTNFAIDIEKNLTLQEAVSRYFEPEVVEASCDNCGESSRKAKTEAVTCPPIILCLQRKRFKANLRKNNQKIDVATVVQDFRYRPLGEVHHKGSVGKGHYWAVVKDHKYDDHRVEKVADKPSSSSVYMVFFELLSQMPDEDLCD